MAKTKEETFNTKFKTRKFTRVHLYALRLKERWEGIGIATLQRVIREAD